MMVGRGPVNRGFNRGAALIALLLSLVVAVPARAEDGYALWLRYAPLEGEALERLEAFAPEVRLPYDHPQGPVVEAALREMRRGLAGLLGHPLPKASDARNTIYLNCATYPQNGDVRVLVIRRGRQLLVGGTGELSCLYGTFAVLR